MPIIIKGKLQSIAGKAVDKVLAAVSKAQATGEDPYLAGVAVKAAVVADEAVSGHLDDTPPWETALPNDDNPQEALRDLEDRREAGKKDRLFLVSRETGQEYEVLEYDSDTLKAKLVSPTGLSLHPTLGPRETMKYFPIWRKGA